MKLKYIFPIFFATLIWMASCDDDESITLLDEVQVSSSYVAIPLGGGSTAITVTAQDNWTVEKVTTEKDEVAWLTISATSGSAGKSELTFSAPAAVDGRKAEVLLKCGGKSQRINVTQGVIKVTEAKVEEVKAGPDGKTFRVTGVCTSIENTLYGNWYLTDETGSLFIYGTLDAKGKEKNFLSLGLEVGDEVTIEGPKSTYKDKPQMVKVTVTEINKSLIKVDSLENATLPLEGGDFTAYLTCKGQGVSVNVPEDAKSWLSISSIQSAGTNAVVIFKAAANSGGDRNTTITFHTTDGRKDYTSEATLTQKGAIIEAPIAQFLAAPVGDTQYRLSGIITKIEDATKGNLTIRDFSGETYVYRLSGFKVEDLKEGNIITIVGKRAEYKGNPQVGSAVLETVIPVTPVTIGEVLTKPDSKEVYYMVTGEITEIVKEEYGNLYLKDGDETIYLYGCYPGWGAQGDDKKGLLAGKGIKVGDTLTVIAVKTTYKEKPQLSNGVYFSHKSAE